MTYPGVVTLYYANLFDAAFSTIFIGLGLGTEANPLMGMLMSWGVLLFILFKGLFGLSFCYYHHKLIERDNSKIIKGLMWVYAFAFIMGPLGGFLWS